MKPRPPVWPLWNLLAEQVDEHHAGEAGQGAGDHHGDELHPVHLHAERVGGVGVFAGGPQAQAERRLPEHEVREREQRERDDDQQRHVGGDRQDRVGQVGQEEAVLVAEVAQRLVEERDQVDLGDVGRGSAGDSLAEPRPS